MNQTVADFLVQVVAICLGVGLGILFGAWLLQQAFGVLL